MYHVFKNYACTLTSHSAYDVTSIESNGVKIDGFLNPNFMYIPKKVSEKLLNLTPSVLKNHPSCVKRICKHS